MDYFIIFWIIGAILLGMLHRWGWMLLEIGLGGLFVFACAMLYLMEHGRPMHLPEKRTPIYERIEEERCLVAASGISWQIARRIRRHIKEQPALKKGEYYAVFCGRDAVRVMRRDFPTVQFRYVTHTEGSKLVYRTIHSSEAKRALARVLAQKASELADVVVDKPRRCGREVMFTIISRQGYERRKKAGEENEEQTRQSA